MALKATVHKLELAIADMDRSYFQTHKLTIAQHPSENDGRLMVRVLVFALNADDELSFTRGISTDDEPDIWKRNLSGEIDHWIELGQPDEKRIRRACGRARQVSIYCYNKRSSDVWWRQINKQLQRFDNLAVFSLDEGSSARLAELAGRNMKLNFTRQDEDIWLANEEQSIAVSVSSLTE